MTAGVRNLHPGGVSIFGLRGGKHFPVARARRVDARPVVLRAMRAAQRASRVVEGHPCGDARGVRLEASARAALRRARGLGNPVAWAWAAVSRAKLRAYR